MLTNAPRTFNYRTIHDILPLSTKFYTAYLDPRTTCRFCKTSAEKPAHIFYTCTQIQPVWTLIKKSISKLDGANTLDLNYQVVTQFVIPQQIKHLEEHIIYIFSTTRHKIWTHRNEIESGKIYFSAQKIKSIKRSIHHRLAMENQTTSQKFSHIFEDFKTAKLQQNNKTTTRHAIWKTRNQTYYENKLTTPVIKSIKRSIKYKNTMESKKTTPIYSDILQMLVEERSYNNGKKLIEPM